jgi:hypothetical protein
MFGTFELQRLHRLSHVFAPTTVHPNCNNIIGGTESLQYTLTLFRLHRVTFICTNG